MKQKRRENKMELERQQRTEKMLMNKEKMEIFTEEREQKRKQKKMELVQAEKKRCDLREAFYHMAVWNVRDASDVIQTLIDGKGSTQNTLGEKVR